jgi:hypothetical protein
MKHSETHSLLMENMIELLYNRFCLDWRTPSMFEELCSRIAARAAVLRAGKLPILTMSTFALNGLQSHSKEALLLLCQINSHPSLHPTRCCYSRAG